MPGMSNMYDVVPILLLLLLSLLLLLLLLTSNATARVRYDCNSCLIMMKCRRLHWKGGAHATAPMQRRGRGSAYI